jgi:hypothetical protein
LYQKLQGDILNLALISSRSFSMQIGLSFGGNGLFVTQPQIPRDAFH